MRDAPPVSRSELELDRMVAAIGRMVRESSRFFADADRLNAEGRKLYRDYRPATWPSMLAAVGGIAALIASTLAASHG